MVGMPLYFPRPLSGYNQGTKQAGAPVKQTLFDDLKEQHADNFGWAMACCAWQRAVAEDVLQESYLRVLDKRAKFSGRSTAKTWFFGVIKRVAAEYQQSDKRRVLLNLRLAATDGEVPASHAESPGETIYRNEHAGQLQRALMQLAQKQREVLHLVFYSELTLEETARTLQLSLGSVRTHYHRGKQRLAHLLQESVNDEL